MQSESAKPISARRRKAITKTDALEMLSSFLADCARAGIAIERDYANGVVTLRLQQVALATDEEGVYFVPFDPQKEQLLS